MRSETAKRSQLQVSRVLQLKYLRLSSIGKSKGFNLIKCMYWMTCNKFLFARSAHKTKGKSLAQVLGLTKSFLWLLVLALHFLFRIWGVKENYLNGSVHYH